jgi:hypothetical protein
MTDRQNPRSIARKCQPLFLARVRVYRMLTPRSATKLDLMKPEAHRLTALGLTTYGISKYSGSNESARLRYLSSHKIGPPQCLTCC